MTPSTYIGKCKSKGCKRAICSESSAVQDITTAVYKRREFDTTRAFMVNGIRPLAICPDHGYFRLSPIKGKVVENHECDARCLNATGPNCECACGGANHGHNHTR